MANWKHNSGLSLIGVVVATFILVSGTMAILQLTARTEHVGGLAVEQFVATNLAREGLELVQAVRDNNWLVDDPGVTWTEELCENDQSLNPSYQVTIESIANAIIVQANPSVDQQQLFISPSTGQWGHTVSSGQATPYRRLITVDCSQQRVDVASTNPAFVTVLATVTWQSRNQEHTASVKTKLYDWYEEN